MDVFHYTDRKGYNGIVSQIVWVFKAHKQRLRHLPFGAYFTPLHWSDPAFFPRTRVPRNKRRFFFRFLDAGDLKPLDGDRGEFVWYSPGDYPVAPERQMSCGSTGIDEMEGE